MKYRSEDQIENAYVDGLEAAPRFQTARSEILFAADRLVHGDRQATYGEPSDNFGRIAAGWRVLLGADVTAAQVASCMAWVKLCRLVHNPADLDGYIDGAAYLALAGELAGAVEKGKDE